MYCDQVFRLTEKGEQNPLRHSYSYTQKPFTTPEFGIKLDSYTQPGGVPSSSVAAQQAKPAQSLVKNQGLLEYLEPIGESPKGYKGQNTQTSSSSSKPHTLKTKSSSKQTQRSQGTHKTEQADIEISGESGSRKSDGGQTTSQRDGRSAVASANSAKGSVKSQTPQALARALIAEATSGYFDTKKSHSKQQAVELEA